MISQAQAKKFLITKTYQQLNHELPIPLYQRSNDNRLSWWRSWLEDPTIPSFLRQKIGMYIHIPYCNQVCSFCYLEKRGFDSHFALFIDKLYFSRD